MTSRRGSFSSYVPAYLYSAVTTSNLFNPQIFSSQHLSVHGPKQQMLLGPLPTSFAQDTSGCLGHGQFKEMSLDLYLESS